MNVSKKKFNKCFTVHEDSDFHIVNESARKTLCNLFDALGNISSYNDYNAFMEKHNGFSKFNKCTISKYLKTPLELSQGILVVVDNKTHELSLPNRKRLDWFLEKYQYSTYVTLSDSKEEDLVKEVEKTTETSEETKEAVILEETKETKETEAVAEAATQAFAGAGAEAVAGAAKSSGGFWSYFGWN